MTANPESFINLLMEGSPSTDSQQRSARDFLDAVRESKRYSWMGIFGVQDLIGYLTIAIYLEEKKRSGPNISTPFVRLADELHPQRFLHLYQLEHGIDPTIRLAKCLNGIQKRFVSEPKLLGEYNF